MRAQKYFFPYAQDILATPLQICTRLGVVHSEFFDCFFLLLATSFAACEPPSRENHRKALCTQQR